MTESLWLDEATTALVSQMSLRDIFAKFLPGDFHPPFYYLFMKFWVGIFGPSEVSLRTPSLIFALLTIFLVYKIVLLITDHYSLITAKRSALLLATAPLLFYYAQEARMYTMTMFFVTLSIFSFVKMKHSRGLGWGIAFALSLALTAATDYTALLILPVFWYLGRRIWKKLLMSHIILAGFWLIWLPFFISQLAGGLKTTSNSPAWSELLGQASLKNLALIPIKFMIGRISFDDKWLYVLVVSLVALLFGYLVYKARKAEKIYWLWLIIPLALGLAISFRIPILSYFRFLYVLPAFYILVASGIEKSKTFLFLVLGVNLLCTLYYGLTPRFHHEDWRTAAAAIGQSQIVLPANSQKEALIYYGKGNQIVAEPTEKEVWLSRYVWEVFDLHDSMRLKIEGMGYRKIGEYNFNGVVFWKYAYRD